MVPYLPAGGKKVQRWLLDRLPHAGIQRIKEIVDTMHRCSVSIFESKTRQLSGAPKSPNRHGMSFDLFVQACISLKRMTDVFKRYDDDRDGYITVSFEEFLTGEFT